MTIERGDVLFVDLDPVRGREQAGRRPVVVLAINEINQRPLVVAVVVGTKDENVHRDYPTNVRVSAEESGLPLETIFMGFQVRSLDPQRFPKVRAGHLADAAMQRVEFAVRRCLGL